jgi:cytochrome c553
MMQPRYSISIGLLALLLAGSAMAAGNAENGKKLAQQHVCFSCHGQDYKGMATFPPLVGKDAAYIQTQLKAFKSGERKTPMAGVMKPNADKLSDQDIADLAAFFGGLK